MPVKDCLIMFQEGSCASEGMSDYVPGRILCHEGLSDYVPGRILCHGGMSDYVPGRILCQ